MKMVELIAFIILAVIVLSLIIEKVKNVIKVRTEGL